MHHSLPGLPACDQLALHGILHTCSVVLNVIVSYVDIHTLD